MEATTQYSDFTGTAAAEFNNDDSFCEFCAAVGINLEELQPVGFRFHDSYDKFDILVRCLNKTDNRQFEIKVECSSSEFFHLFRSLNVIIYDSSMKHLEQNPIDEYFSIPPTK